MPPQPQNHGIEPHPLMAACLDRRRALGLSLRAVGERSGIAFQYISQLELGYITPTLDTADRLLGALGLRLVVAEVEPAAPRVEVHSRESP